MAEICKLLHIKQLHSTSYHHQSIGALENSHKVLGAYLRTMTENKTRSWSTWLSYWCFSYNTTVHTETKYTPYELVFGKKCKIPSNLVKEIEPMYNFDDYSKELKFRLQKAHQDAHCNLVASKLKRKDKYDKNANPIVYKKGDLILVQNETGDKLSVVYNGPFEVLEEETPNVKAIKNSRQVTVHKNRTKLYHKDD